MKTIKERAEKYGIESANLLSSEEWTDEQRQNKAKVYAKVYSNIAEEQQKIDIENMCEWLSEHLPIIHTEEGDFVRIGVGHQNVSIEQYLNNFRKDIAEWE